MRHTHAIPTLLFTLGVLALVSAVPRTSSAACPAGHRLATAGDEAVKRGTIKVDTCYDPKDVSIGTTALEGAKEAEAYLLKHICGNRKAGLPSGFNPKDTSPGNWDTIRNDNGYVYFSAENQMMDAGAMRCFVDFFEFAKQKGFEPCVSSGFRTLAHQRASCYAPNSVVCGRGRGSGPRGCPTDLASYASCPHTNGYALDINDKKGRTSQILDLARQFGKFSKVGVGASDPWHVEARGCAGGSTRQSVPPDTWDGKTKSAPTSGIMDGFRRALGIDTPPQPTPQAQPAPAAQPSLPQQPGSVQSNQLFNDRGTGLGTPGTAPTGTAVPVIASPPGGTKASTTVEGADQASYYSSVSDQLLQLAYDTPLATSTSVATSVPLTIDGSDVKTIDTGSEATGTATSSGLLAYGAPGTVLPSSNTFVSNDLGGGPYQVVASYRGEPTGFIALLVQLRDAFAALLNILRPMGIREAISPSADPEEARLEHDYDPEADFQAGLQEDISIEFVTE